MYKSVEEEVVCSTDNEDNGGGFRDGVMDDVCRP